MAEPVTESAPQVVVEMPKADEYDENAAQLANDNTIYALIIGNNDYQASQFSSLSGAVSDADAIESTLKASMSLKDSHIISLRNATRQQMLYGFHRLEDITKESEDPCMIIFYAGHGAQAPRPKGWEEYTTDSEVIEMLCPSDLGVVGADGRVVEGIPDRMVSALLNSLAAKRGNNITVILDCCHSAGANRDDNPDRTPRYLSDLPPITAEANAIPTPSDEDSPNGDPMRGIRVATGFGGKYSASHVLLAACGRDKKAYEDKKARHGYFTNALITFLQGKKVETETYLSLMHSISMPIWQTPHCMGVNADRPLFNRRGSRSDPSYIPCKVSGDKKASEGGQDVRFTLFAGLAEGIVPGEVFDLYKTVPFEGQKKAGPPFGTMVAANVGTTSTVLQRLQGKNTPVRVPKVFYARRIVWPNAPASVYCEDVELLKSLSKLTRDGMAVKGGRVLQTDLVNDATEASLIVKVEGKDVYLERNDASLDELLPNGRRFPRPLDREVPEQVQGAISGWRHFNYHLKRKGRNEFPQIRMEMHYLEPTDGDWDNENPEYKPVGENLLANEPAHVLVSDEQTKRPLGLMLYNDGDVDVYPYLFYFDPTELTITPWPLVAEGGGEGEVDPPLLKRSRLAVGYGNGGADPLKFYFEDGTTKDVGYFKLFVTCSPASFRSLNQERSPFPRTIRGGNEEEDEGEDEDMGPDLDEAERDAAEEELKKRMYADQWGVKLNTVIQEKKIEEKAKSP